MPSTAGCIQAVFGQVRSDGLRGLRRFAANWVRLVLLASLCSSHAEAFSFGYGGDLKSLPGELLVSGDVGFLHVLQHSISKASNGLLVFGHGFACLPTWIFAVGLLTCWLVGFRLCVGCMINHMTTPPIRQLFRLLRGGKANIPPGTATVRMIPIILSSLPAKSGNRGASGRTTPRIPLPLINPHGKIPRSLPGVHMVKLINPPKV